MLGYIVDSWITYWPFVVVSGIVSAYFLWLPGGWWYNLRLKWSGSSNHDKKIGRIVYIYTSFIMSLPAVIYTILQTFVYPDYRAAYNSDSDYALLLLIFPFWAISNSYRAVVNVFYVKKTLARLWFLILPILAYVIIIGMLAAFFSYIGILNGET